MYTSTLSTNYYNTLYSKVSEKCIIKYMYILYYNYIDNCIIKYTCNLKRLLLSTTNVSTSVFVYKIKFSAEKQRIVSISNFNEIRRSEIAKHRDRVLFWTSRSANRCWQTPPFTAHRSSLHVMSLLL